MFNDHVYQMAKYTLHGHQLNTPTARAQAKEEHG